MTGAALFRTGKLLCDSVKVYFGLLWTRLRLKCRPLSLREEVFMSSAIPDSGCRSGIFLI